MNSHSPFIISNLQTEILYGNRTICGKEWGLNGIEVYNDPFSRLYWVESGSGEINFLSGERYELIPGRLFVIPEHNPARYRTNEKMILYWIHFKARIFGILELFSATGWQRNVEINRNSRMKYFWNQLLRLQNPGNISDLLKADAMLRQLLANFATEFSGGLEHNQLSMLERLKPAIEFIERNLHRNIKLKDLTELVPLQEAYFCNLFSRTIGISPIEFINRKKVEKAQFLLLQTDSRLKEIAFNIGIKDVYYFSRLFKKLTGISPSCYRLQKEHREIEQQ